MYEFKSLTGLSQIRMTWVICKTWQNYKSELLYSKFGERCQDPIWVLFGCPERNLWSCIIKIKIGCPWSFWIIHHIADSFFIISISAHTYDLLTLSTQESVQCNLVISCFSIKRNESRDNFERIKQAASQCQHAVSLEYSVLMAQTKLVLELWIPHTLV